MWNTLIKTYNLDYDRQQIFLTSDRQKLFKLYHTGPNKTFTHDYLFQSVSGQTELEDILNVENGLFLRRLSEILKWFNIPSKFIIVDTTDDAKEKENCLPNELFNGRYILTEMLEYNSILSGNFDPITIFIHCDEKNKYVLYNTKYIETSSAEIKCEFCGELKDNTFKVLKCIYTNHKTLIEENQCVICERNITIDPILHFKGCHQLALSQFQLLKRVKKDLEKDDEALQKYFDKQNIHKDYEIIHCDRLLKLINTTKITIDVAYDFETFPLSLGEAAEAVPYILSLSMHPNFYFIENCNVDQEKFIKLVGHRFRNLLTDHNFTILNPEQNKVFCLDPLFKPSINAWTALEPRSYKKRISQMENEMLSSAPIPYNKGEVTGKNLMQLKSQIVNRMMMVIRNFLIYLNGDCREHDIYGEVNEVVLRMTAFNGSRFDNYYLEHYLKMAAPPHVMKFFKNRRLIQGKSGISKIALNLYCKSEMDLKSREKKPSTAVKFEVIDVSSMRAPSTLAKLLVDLNIKDLKFPMHSNGHEYMAKYCLNLVNDIKCCYPVSNEIKVDLLGCPKTEGEERNKWENDFEECLVAHKTMFKNSHRIFSYQEYYHSYGIKDSISAYCLLPFIYKESIHYLKMIQNEKMLNHIHMLDYFGLAVSTSGLAFKIWHIDQENYVQPRGLAAITIRETLIGGFCQPHVKGEIESEEEFMFPDSQHTQIDIVSMYANAQRTCYMASGTCESGTLKVEEAINFCNKILATPLNITIGLAHYQPIFAYYILIPPTYLKDHCELGPIGVRMKMKYTGNVMGHRATKNVENLNWCGIPRIQALTPQDALTMRNMGFFVRILDTKEAIKRTVLFQTFSDPLKKFNEVHIKMKIQAKKDGNFSLEKLNKLINNGMYGRTIMNPALIETVLLKFSSEITDLYHRQFKGEIEILKLQELNYKILINTHNGINKVVEDIYYQAKFKHSMGKSSGPIHLGAQILGHSHAIYFSNNRIVDPHVGLIPVHRRCPCNLYSDTDSWYPQNNLLKRFERWKFGSFICESPENPFDNNKWCVIIEEKEPDGINHTRAIFLGKKNYCFTTKNDLGQAKDLILVSKGQNKNALSGSSFKSVLNNQSYDELLHCKEKIETSRLSFYRSLFVDNTQLPLKQTTLTRELKINNTIMGRHAFYPHVTFSPYSVTQIQPNEPDDLIQEIIIYDGLYLHPEIITGKSQFLTPEILYQLVYHCFLHENKEDFPILKTVKATPDRRTNVSNISRFMNCEDGGW